ncbi:MAG: hypothetical protein GXO55_09955 [Chloroflexi bacterium]|nr:hypothetical protein [Chloroflexota bacterium]
MDGEGNRESGGQYILITLTWRAPALGWLALTFSTAVPPNIPPMVPV